MTIAKRIIPVLTVCAAAGWFMVAVQPAVATAAARPAHEAHRPALACTYQVHRVRKASFLNVRKGPGLGYQPIGRLRLADGRFAGACGASRGWVALKSSTGKPGWASAGYLRRLSIVRHVAVNRPDLACAYRVVHVRKAGFLNVRKGPGLRYRPIGRLRVSDGHFAGGCGRSRGWVAVKSSSGKPGWAWAHYLRRS